MSLHRYIILILNRINFRYKLENWDQDWVLANSQRRYVSYSNLEAGDYIFRLESANQDNIWNANPVELAIKSSPSYMENLVDVYHILFVHNRTNVGV